MNKFMKKIMSKKDGFTLVELIVVIAILAILAGVAVPVYSGYINNANEAADVTTCSAIKTAALATMATTGEVNNIQVSTTATNGKNVITSVKINGTVAVVDGVATFTETNAVELIGNKDFLQYFTGSEAGSVDSVLKAGTTAIWDGNEWYFQ